MRGRGEVFTSLSSFRDAPLGAGPESILPVSIRNARIKINPSRIFFFNQANLPVTPPFLQFFLRAMAVAASS
jgi:hypothetical protein